MELSHVLSNYDGVRSRKPLSMPHSFNACHASMLVPVALGLGAARLGNGTMPRLIGCITCHSRQTRAGSGTQAPTGLRG